MTTITTLLLASVGGMQSCRKKKCHDPQNPDCENYDPCWGKKANASFSIKVNLHGRFFEYDTVGENEMVYFEAKYPADSFKWIVGAAIVKSNKCNFSAFPIKKYTPVTLISYRISSSNCFPNDDGIDTQTRFVYCWKGADVSTGKVDYFPLYGTYKGMINDNPNDLRTIKIKDSVQQYFNQSYYSGWHVLMNWPFKGTDTYKMYPSGFWSNDIFQEFSPCVHYIKTNGRPSLVAGFPNIPRMEGYAYLNRNNKNQIIIELKYHDTLSPTSNIWHNWKFIGDRIQ